MQGERPGDKSRFYSSGSPTESSDIYPWSTMDRKEPGEPSESNFPEKEHFSRDPSPKPYKPIGGPDPLWFESPWTLGKITIHIGDEVFRVTRDQLCNRSNYFKELIKAHQGSLPPHHRINFPSTEFITPILRYWFDDDMSLLRSLEYNVRRSTELKALLVNADYIGLDSAYWRSFYIPLVVKQIECASASKWWSKEFLSDKLLTSVLDKLQGYWSLRAALAWYENSIRDELSASQLDNLNLFLKQLGPICTRALLQVSESQTSRLRKQFPIAMRALVPRVNPQNSFTESAVEYSSKSSVQSQPSFGIQSQSSSVRLPTPSNFPVDTFGKRYLDINELKRQLDQAKTQLACYRCPVCQQVIPRAAKETLTCIRLWHSRQVIVGSRGIQKWPCCGKVIEAGVPSGCKFEITSHSDDVCH